MRLLAISGSLRCASTNTATLKAMALLAPPGVHFVLYDRLASLPHFNPDLDRADAPHLLPREVGELRENVRRSDGVVICSPEYAHGVPGSLKNALDWLVGSIEFPQKPVALINTSPRAVHADAQLRETLATMSASLIEAASLTVPIEGKARDRDTHAIVSDLALSEKLGAALLTILAAIQRA
ncbi:NADPH-dependent FMN reductase [Methylocystis sp. IM3]|uniref:NADPH-dependent FMN reductase n=1 Tax=unclassified Methylocystis TaxID=2625913 RepID=UPI00311930EE